MNKEKINRAFIQNNRATANWRPGNSGTERKILKSKIMYLYNGYHFMGMHLIWWFIWIVFLVSLFGWYTPVPKSRRKRDQNNKAAHHWQFANVSWCNMFFSFRRRLLAQTAEGAETCCWIKDKKMVSDFLINFKIEVTKISKNEKAWHKDDHWVHTPSLTYFHTSVIWGITKHLNFYLHHFNVWLPFPYDW